MSDDEDETHPNIDTPSLFRWRHQARVEKMQELEKKKTELARNKNRYFYVCLIGKILACHFLNLKNEFIDQLLSRRQGFENIL